LAQIVCWEESKINLQILKALKAKKGRDELKLFIVEGEKPVMEIPADWKISAYVVSEAYAKEKEKVQELIRAPLMVLKEGRFASISDMVTPQGILAVVEKREYKLDHLLEKNPFILIGEQLADPGNIGTLIRTAAAAGASGVILSYGSGELHNPKTIRASSGACLRLPIIEGVHLHEIIPLLKSKGVTILATHLHRGKFPYELDLGSPDITKKGLALLIGNEARGITDGTEALADQNIKLPMAPGVDSLNASVAGGIFLYEILRQRHTLNTELFK